jgi:hypothetical protein
MNRDFKGVWIPKEIWLNKELKLIEKCFLVEIDSLDNDDGCFASNSYFAEFFGISKGRCSQIIKSLEEKKMIKVKYYYEGRQIVKRVLNILKGGVYFSKGGCLENAKDNNTSINNTILTYKEKSIKKEIEPEPNTQQQHSLKTPKPKKEKVAPKRKKGLDFNDITWPPVFEKNVILKNTFLEFAQMRKDCKKPYKTLKGIETKIRALAKDCQKYGIETVIGAIEFSTGSEYMGIFVQDYHNKKSKHEKQQTNNQPKQDIYTAYYNAIYNNEPEAQNNTIDIDWDE